MNISKDGITVLSLFDGISCGMVALERAGIKVKKYYASEIDENAEAVSKYHFPNIIRLGDVVYYDNWNLAQIDLLIGGSPCQDLSIAKANRKGLKGEKSSLFWKYVEILHKFKPEYFLFENNYSMPEKDKEKITEVLGVHPVLINSSLVSGQSRKRLYLTNIPNVTQPKDKNILLQDILQSGTVDRGKSLCVTRSYARFSGSQSYLCRRYFGKSFGQAVFEGDIQSIKEKWIKDPYFKSLDTNIRQMTVTECERLQTLPDNYTKYGIVEDSIAEISKNKRYEMIGNGWTVDVISHILSGLNYESR